MTLLLLKEDKALSICQGDFGTKVSEGALLVPPNVMAFARSNDVRNAEELVSLVESFPTAVSKSFGWTDDAARKAIASLRTQFETYGELPSKSSRLRSPGLGARRPDVTG